MSIRYDKTTDTLYISLGQAEGDLYELESGNFMVIVDDSDGLVVEGLREALSKGRYMRGAIIGAYSYEKGGRGR